MILALLLVFLFLWGYMRIFPQGKRLRKIITVTVFSILITFLVSFLTVYGFFWLHNPVLSGLSLPSYLNEEFSFLLHPPVKYDAMFCRVFFADTQLFEMRFYVSHSARKPVIGRFPVYENYPWHGQLNVDYTVTLFYQLLLIFTALNMIGVPLGVFAYKLTEKLVRKVWTPSQIS